MFENFCNNMLFLSFILRAFASLREISISEFRTHSLHMDAVM
jgi:hypothetical protein